MSEGLLSARVDFFEFGEGAFMAERVDVFSIRSGVIGHMLLLK